MSLRKEKAIQMRIERFFEERHNLYANSDIFESVFESYLCEVKDKTKKVYLLDSLSDLQKEIFFEYYCGYVGGGGTYYSQLYCNDNVYRQEYRIGDKLVLIGK